MVKPRSTPNSSPSIGSWISSNGEPVDFGAEWSKAPLNGAAWSSTMDEALRVVDQIAGTAPLGLAGIAVKIGALRWFLEATEAILDAKGLRQLRSLDRDSRRLTGR